MSSTSFDTDTTHTDTSRDEPPAGRFAVQQLSRRKIDHNKLTPPICRKPCDVYHITAKTEVDGIEAKQEDLKDGPNFLPIYAVNPF
jgi:hypothetical protein